MFHLVTAVLAIALLSIVSLAGIWGLNPGRAVQADVASRVMSTYRVIELGVGAYRVANNGALPGAATWRDDISPYTPYAISAPTGLSWGYVVRGGGASACVTGVDDLTADARAGLRTVLRQMGADGSATVVQPHLAQACDGSGVAGDAGPIALVFPIQAGG